MKQGLKVGIAMSNFTCYRRSVLVRVAEVISCWRKDNFDSFGLEIFSWRIGTSKNGFPSTSPVTKLEYIILLYKTPKRQEFCMVEDLIVITFYFFLISAGVLYSTTLETKSIAGKMAGQWISDGSASIIIGGSGDVSEIECELGSESSGGNVYNGLWKESDQGATAGTHYWKIHITKLDPDGIFVGLTDLEKFKTGWELKGLLYGGPGNLSNGGTLLVGSYGPKIQSGNTVGILAVFEEEKLKVYFDLDGTPLGQAFDLPATVLNGVFPTVHFSGGGKATIVKSGEIPANLSRAEPVYEGIEGYWRCTELSGENPDSRAITVRIFKDETDENSYKVGLRVINNISFTLRRDPVSGAWIPAEAIRSTRMGGPPEIMKLESEMSHLVGNPTTLTVDEGFLVVSNADGVTSKWERYSTAKSPVTVNPFL